MLFIDINQNVESFLLLDSISKNSDIYQKNIIFTIFFVQIILIL